MKLNVGEPLKELKHVIADLDSLGLSGILSQLEIFDFIDKSGEKVRVESVYQGE